jgi:purine-binding chemotaxis protein CheW
VVKTKKNKGSYITFVIDDKTYGINLLYLDNVAGNPKIKLIENGPDFVIGSFKSANVIVPILNTRSVLAMPCKFSKDKLSILTIKVLYKGKVKLVGLIVDSLSGIKKIDSSKIEKLPSYEENDFVAGVTYCDNDMVLLLNLEKVINEKNVICFLNKIWDYEINIEKTNKNGAKHG